MLCYALQNVVRHPASHVLYISGRGGAGMVRDAVAQVAAGIFDRERAVAR